jgi:sugar/nucleoside kinase (ribokinase family)
VKPRIPAYLVIGHVTRDLLPDGTFRSGGTATYSGLTAARLGLRVGVVTSAEGSFPLFEGLPTVDVRCRLAQHTSTFENIYFAGKRRQYIRAVADPLTLDDVPSEWREARIVHLGPVAQEVDPRLAEAFPGALLGVTPQGWMRRWDAEGLVSPIEWAHAECVLAVADVVILSLEDLRGDRQPLERYRRQARTLILTIGREGAIVYSCGREERVPAYVVEEVDPTGAGDLFATGYLIRLLETGDVIEAARFANCVASFAVEAVGPANIPSREQVEERMRQGHLRR